MSLDRRALLLTGLAAPTAAATGARAAGDDPVDSHLRDRMAARGIPGAAVAVLRDGRVVKARGYGQADVESGRAATAQTVFPMASASKFLSGLVAMRLAEAGRLDLDRPAAAYLPELAPVHPEVRVHQLLSHTSGLAPLSDNAAYSAEYAKREKAAAFVDARQLEFFTPQEVLEAGAPLPAREPPGTVWRYSQYPLFLFGQIVARLTGKPFEAFVQEQIFAPLGMTDAAYGDYRALIPGRRSNNYSRETGVLQNLALKYTPAFWPAAGCNASAADLARLLLALEPGRLLRGEGLARLAAPVAARKADGGDAAYGLAATSMVTDGRRWIGHEGGGCCYLGWWPQQRLGVAVLFNLSGSGEDGIERKIAALVLG